MAELFDDFVKAVNETVMDPMDQELADCLVETIETMVQTLTYVQSRGVDISEFHRHQKDIWKMIVRALGVYQNFKLIGKPDSEHVHDQKRKCISLLTNIHYISDRVV